MSIQDQNIKTKKRFDLEERTAKFGEEIVEFAKTIPLSTVNTPIINQLVRAGTSPGANYVEADGAESGKDFRHKIAICKKEAKETKYWLRIAAKTNPDKKEQARKLWQEAHELTLIFSSILRKKEKTPASD